MHRNTQHDGTDELSSSDSSGSDSDDGGARGGAGGVNHAQAQLDAAAAASEDSLNSADDIGSNDDGAETFETGQSWNVPKIKNSFWKVQKMF